MLQTEILEPPQKLLPPPMLPSSQEVTREDIKRARDEDDITQLGAEALNGINPAIVKSVLELSRSTRKPKIR